MSLPASSIADREARLQLIRARCALDRAELHLAILDVRDGAGQVRERLASPARAAGSLFRAFGFLRTGAPGFPSGWPWWVAPVATGMLRGVAGRFPMRLALLGGLTAGAVIWFRKAITGHDGSDPAQGRPRRLN